MSPRASVGRPPCPGRALWLLRPAERFALSSGAALVRGARGVRARSAREARGSPGTSPPQRASSAGLPHRASSAGPPCRASSAGLPHRASSSGPLLVPPPPAPLTVPPPPAPLIRLPPTATAVPGTAKASSSEAGNLCCLFVGGCWTCGCLSCLGGVRVGVASLFAGFRGLGGAPAESPSRGDETACRTKCVIQPFLGMDM